MKRNIQAIPLDLIKLDQENVRFGGDVAISQREAIEFMMADSDDGKKILKLAEHIAVNGLDPTELQLATPSPDNDGTYIVLEGNRRLTALKLLQNPNLCPDEKLVRGFSDAQILLNGNYPSSIECAVIPTREEGDKWIELKHTGQNNGIGRVNWNGDIRDERRARQTGVESIGRQIRNLICDNLHIFSSAAKDNVKHIPVTTLTRLFSSLPAQTAFGLKVVNKELTPQFKLQFIKPSVEFALELFVNQGYNVKDIMSDLDRKKFILCIPPEISPEKVSETIVKESSNSQDKGPNYTTDSENKSENNSFADKSNDLESENSTETKEKQTRARPSARARKYLTPWSLNITNNRINEIYRELRSKLVVNDCPNSASITFRVFIEVSADFYMDNEKQAGRVILRTDNNKPINVDDKLSAKVQAVASHLETQGLLDKHQAKALKKRATSADSIGSIDHLNQFVHSSACAPLPSELNDIADEYRPFFEAIWN